MGDQEFATVEHGALTNTIGTVVVVLIILWLALKSARIIVAVFVNLFVGLAITAALGLMMVHALNMISVAFAVLFVGLGVDFGIQFSVRYRAERHKVPKLHEALVLAADHVGVPLTLAAAAVAAGFLSFLPTDYRGVAELGEIAGVGMVIAYLTSITLLPALLTVLNPPGEPEAVGYHALAPVDRFLQKYRVLVIGGTVGIAVLGLPLLYYLQLRFRSDPSAQPQGRIDRDLSRPARRSAHRRQRGQCGHADAGAGGHRGRASAQAAGGGAGNHPAKLRAGGSAAEAGADRGARSQDRSAARASRR